MPFVPPSRAIPVLDDNGYVQTPYGLRQQALESNGLADNFAAGATGTLASWIAGANALLGQENGSFQQSMAQFSADHSAAANDLLGQVVQQAPNLIADVYAFGAGRRLAGGIAKAAGLGELGAGASNVAGAAGTIPLNYPQHFSEAVGKGADRGNAGIAALADSAMDVLPVTAMLGRTASKLAAAPSEALVEYGQNLNDDASAHNFDFNAVWNNPEMSAARRDAAITAGLSAGALTPAASFLERSISTPKTDSKEPKDVTIDVVDAKTGELLGSTTGPAGGQPPVDLDTPAYYRNNQPKVQDATPQAVTPTDLDTPTVLRNAPQRESVDVSAIVGNRPFTINPVVEKKLAEYYGVTPKEAAEVLASVAPEEASVNTWSTPAVGKAAKILEDRFYTNVENEDLSNHGVTQDDAAQGLIAQLKQVADIKDAFDETRRRDEALLDPRINSLEQMQASKNARVAEQTERGEMGPPRPEPENLVIPTRQERLDAKPGQVYDMVNREFTNPKVEPVQQEAERRPLDRKTIDMFGVEGNVFPEADEQARNEREGAEKFPNLYAKAEEDAKAQAEHEAFNEKLRIFNSQMQDNEQKIADLKKKHLTVDHSAPVMVSELGGIALPKGMQSLSVSDAASALEKDIAARKTPAAKASRQKVLDAMLRKEQEVLSVRKQQHDEEMRKLEGNRSYQLYMNERDRLTRDMFGDKSGVAGMHPDDAAINTMDAGKRVTDMRTQEDNFNRVLEALRPHMSEDEAIATAKKATTVEQKDTTTSTLPRMDNSIPDGSPVGRFLDAIRNLVSKDASSGKHKQSGSVTNGTLDKLLTAIRSHVPNFPDPVVLGSIDEVPHDARNVVNDRTTGFYHSPTGKIYLLPPAFESEATLEATLIHEGVHLGLDKKFGGFFAEQMYDLADKLGGKAGVIKLAKSMGLKKDIDGYVDMTKDMPDDQAAVVLLHEVAAFHGERGGKQGILSKMFAKAAANVLGALGFTKLAAEMRDTQKAKEVVDSLVAMSREAIASGVNSKQQRKLTRNTGSVFSGALKREPAKKEPAMPLRNKLAAAVDAVNRILSKSGFGLAAYSLVSANTSVISVVSPEIAARVSSTLKSSKDKQRASVGHIMGTMHKAMDKYNLSPEERVRATNYIVGEVHEGQIKNIEGHDDQRIVNVVRETRQALRDVYDRFVQPLFFSRAQAALIRASRTDGDSEAVAKAMKAAIDGHFTYTDDPEKIAAAVGKGRDLYAINPDNTVVKLKEPPKEGGVFVLKHDRGHNHFPRIYDYDAIMGDKQGFIDQLLSVKDASGKPYVKTAEDAEDIFNTITANPDRYFQPDAIHSAEAVGAPVSGREKERKYLLPNYVFGKYIKRDVSAIVPIYMSQLMNSASFMEEFGPIAVDDAGNVDIRDTSNEIARMLNGIKDVSVRLKVKRAFDASFNPNYQTTRWGTEMRVLASGAQFAAALAFMPLVVLSSLPEMANHIAAGRTAMERDIAKKVMWKTITNMFSEKGRASNAMMRYRMESLGIISSEIVDHAMHGLSQAQELIGMEGRLKSNTGEFYRRTGITRYSSFQEMLAGTIALEALRTASKALLSNETNAYDKQQAISTLVRFTGVQPAEFAKMSPKDKLATASKLAEHVRVWEQSGEGSVFDGETPAQIEANKAINLALNEGVRVRVAHANAGDVPFYFNDPIGKVVGQFKRFFYGATANILPNLTANLLDGEKGEGFKQLVWFASLGIPAAAIGLMVAHAIKYAAVTEIGNAITGSNSPQTPFSVWQHDNDFATNLLTESSIYATTGMLSAAPYAGIMERPGGLLEPLNWAAGAGLVSKAFHNPESLIDNAVLAAMMWYGGEKLAAKMDERYKQRVDSKR